MEPLKDTFNTVLSSLSQDQMPVVNKLNLQINFVDPAVYEYTVEGTKYESAVELLKNTYIKPKNNIFAIQSSLLLQFQISAKLLSLWMFAIKPLKARVDTGSSENFISEDKGQTLNLKTFQSHNAISMRSTNLSSTTKGHCSVTLEYDDQIYRSVKWLKFHLHLIVLLGQHYVL